jgi:hypothetical protein
MTSITSFLTMLATLVAIGFHPAPVHAQSARTFVSSLGNDANDCTRFAPCRTFQQAHDNTLAAGEITVLDPGGYGALTIIKAISIINDGVGEAGILVSGGVIGITINAGASDAVSLRGLTVKGIGFGGGNGIVFKSGGTLTIENSAIRTLTGSSGVGISFLPNASSHLAVLNTIVTDNSNTGLLIQPAGAGIVTATLSRVQLLNNGGSGLSLVAGLGGTATINAVVEDSIAAKNNSAGFFVHGCTTPQARLMVIRSIAAHNGTGIGAQCSNATVRIGQSTLTANGFGWQSVFNGLVLSYVDNNIDGNADPGSNGPIPNVVTKK